MPVPSFSLKADHPPAASLILDHQLFQPVLELSFGQFPPFELRLELFEFTLCLPEIHHDHTLHFIRHIETNSPIPPSTPLALGHAAFQIVSTLLKLYTRMS